MVELGQKIGIVSCSGEDCLGGTISRLATRTLLDENSNSTVTICLPLYLTGGEEERNFAENYPTIAVDGCSKRCARRATEKYSGKVTAAVDVSDIIGNNTAEAGALSTRHLTDTHREMIRQVATEIQEKIAAITTRPNVTSNPDSGHSTCGCKS